MADNRLSTFLPDDKAAFGVFPQMKPRRRLQDREGSANVPLDVTRGRLAGMLGLPADLANLLQSPMPTETFGNTQYEPAQQLPYDSEYFLKNLPLAPTSRVGEIAGQAGAFVPLNPMPAARAAAAGAMVVGRAGERLAERVVPQIMEHGGMGAEMLQGMSRGAESYALPPAGRSGFGAFDPRYDPRVNEQARMQAMTRDVELNPGAANAPTVSLADFEGRPFITSMADRTAAGGRLVGVDDVRFNRPVELMGGQDYMFNNPGQVWASGKQPAKALMKYADEIKAATGQDPLYLPYRMAPTGGDFAQMTGETMLAYADASMGKMQKRQLDKSIKQYIPDWAGVSNPTSVDQFRQMPDQTRKAIKDMMDKKFRNEGGLNIGSARLAVSDPAQLEARQGGIMNVGEIYAGKPIITESGHPAYPSGVPGRGIGTVSKDTSIFEMLPEYAKARNIADPRMPSDADMRSISMKPYAGVITEKMLRQLGY